MNQQEFLNLPPTEATKRAIKMLLSKKINQEQYNRLLKAIEHQQELRLYRDVVEVFGEEGQ